MSLLGSFLITLILAASIGLFILVCWTVVLFIEKESPLKCTFAIILSILLGTLVVYGISHMDNIIAWSSNNKPAPAITLENK